MHFDSQVHVLYLCAKCVSVDSLVVFHDRNWRTPDDILKRLQEFGDFAFSRTIKTFMQGSGERKTAWLFYRDQLNFCCTVTSDSSPCEFSVFAYLIELHQTRGTRCNVAVFAPLRGHCLALANAEATAHCAQPPYFSVNRLFIGPAAVGNVLASGPVRLSQRRLSDIHLRALPRHWRQCHHMAGWAGSLGAKHSGHCAIAPLRLRLALTRVSVRLGGDDSPAE